MQKNDFLTKNIYSQKLDPHTCLHPISISTNEHPFQFILNPALMTAPWLRFVGAKQ